ncbi:uncharacterized protein LOC135387137 isoform X2 [Ornithodoros turicata]
MRFAMIIATFVAVATGPSEVRGVPFKAVFKDHVAFPDFELSLSGVPTRNVKFTKGRAGPLNVVLTPTRGSLGAYKTVLSLRDMRVIYEAVATEPKEEFQVVVDVIQGLVEVERTKTAGGEFELKDVTFKDLNVYVQKPAEFSSHGKQNTLFEEELKKKIVEFVKLFVQGDVVNDALTNFGADTPQLTSTTVVTTGPSEVRREPFKAVFEEQVVFPDFEFSVSGVPTKNVIFTKGRAGPLSVVFKPTRGSHGAYKTVLSLKDLRVIYEAVATEPKEEFQVVVNVIHCLVEVERRKTAGGKFELKNVIVKDLDVYVDKPANISSDEKQNTLFEEEVKKKIVQFLEVFAQGEMVNDALTDLEGHTSTAA